MCLIKSYQAEDDQIFVQTSISITKWDDPLSGYMRCFIYSLKHDKKTEIAPLSPSYNRPNIML